MIICQRSALFFVFSVFLTALTMVACDQNKNAPVPIVQKTISMDVPFKKEGGKNDETTAASPMNKAVEKTTSADIPAGKIGKATDRSAVQLVSSNVPDGDPSSHDEKKVDADTFQSLIVVEKRKYYYSGEGRIDPFEPLIKESSPQEEAKDVVVEEEVPRRILTPLEKLDFSQMKLVAVISRETGNVAMVQESGGKGYLVNIGTYIGRDSGQVIKIEKDQLLIQERVKDYKGNMVERFQEMKLNKLDEDKG